MYTGIINTNTNTKDMRCYFYRLYLANGARHESYLPGKNWEDIIQQLHKIYGPNRIHLLLMEHESWTKWINIQQKLRRLA